MNELLNWAVLGAGGIADEMAAALAAQGRRFYAVTSRRAAGAQAFAARWQVAQIYESTEALLADPAVQAVYIATPHNLHAGQIMAALKAGKHVLCEKAIALNSRELAAAFELANQKGLVLAEAMTIWHMPLYQELWGLVGNGPLGRVQLLQVNFGSYKEYNMANRYFDAAFAGGMLLDIGVYALSLARSFMEAAPGTVHSTLRFAPSGVDEQAALLLANEAGQMATLTLSLHSKLPKRAVISCEKGYIEIDDYPRAQSALVVEAATGAKRVVEAGSTSGALAYEIAAVEQAAATGDVAPLCQGFTQDVMDVMTGLRKEWGLCYPGEAW